MITAVEEFWNDTKLPDHIFAMFIADYDMERATLKAKIAEMEKTLEKVRDTKADIDRFADLIRNTPALKNSIASFFMN